MKGGNLPTDTLALQVREIIANSRDCGALGKVLPIGGVLEMIRAARLRAAAAEVVVEYETITKDSHGEPSAISDPPAI